MAWIADLVLFVLVVAYVAHTDRERPFNFEHDLYHLRGEACLRHGDCPRTGSVLQGPGYIYLLALCRLFTANPSAEYGLTLGLLGAAAVLSARLIHTHYGWPWGWLAAVVMAGDLNILLAYRAGLHAPFITFPLTVVGWSAVHWMNGRGGRFLVAATVAAAFALHFHGIALLALPGLLVAAALYRPPTSRRALTAAVTAPLLIHCTSVFEALRTRGLPGPLHSISAIHNFLTVQNVARSENLTLPTIAVVVAMLVLAVAALGPTRLRYEPRTAMTLLLFFGGPFVTYLCTRGTYTWLPRYLLVFEPSFGLLLAAALGTGAAWVSRASGPWRIPTLIVGWAGLLLATGGVARSTCQSTSRSRAELSPQTMRMTFREQLAIGQTLTRHGVPPARWLTTVHGSSWWSNSIGPHSIGEMFDSPATVAPDRQQVLLVDHCTRVSQGFARWQQPIAGAWSRELAGYEPQLKPLEMSLSFPDGSIWSSPQFSRILPGPCRLFESKALTKVTGPAPDIGAVRAFDDLWGGASAGTLQLRAVLQPGNGDRVIAVQHGRSCHPDVRLDGQVRAPVQRVTTELNELDRYLISASEHAVRSVDVELTLERNPPPRSEPEPFDQVRFLELDIFEEPWPVCETPR